MSMQREFPLVIRKDGTKFVPVFPVRLVAGDQLIIVRELRGSEVPDGEHWEVNGYTDSGPVVTRINLAE